MECLALQRNSEKCAHCQLVFFRHTQIPLINRSNGSTFHLTLFSEPGLRPISPGGHLPHVLTCNFAYTHDRIRTRNRFVAVLILAGERHGVGLGEIEGAADKLAKLLDAGEKPEAAYMLDGQDRLIAFPQ